MLDLGIGLVQAIHHVVQSVRQRGLGYFVRPLFRLRQQPFGE